MIKVEKSKFHDFLKGKKLFSMIFPDLCEPYKGTIYKEIIG